MIRFDGVSKRFPGATAPALSNLSFEVRPGEIFGLLGHNGAGKSTALGILLGLVHPDAGEAWIDGVPVQRERERALRPVGAIFESPRFYDYLSGWRNLLLLTAYSDFRDDDLARETVRWVGLERAIERRVATYSQGMRQRLALAQALLPRPRVLLLDEPTNGLDPDGIIEFRERIRDLRERLGLTVLLNSHLLSEVERLCDRVAILRAGHLVYQGACGGPSTVTASGHLHRIVCPDADWTRAAAMLPGLGVVVPDQGLVRIPPDRDPAEILAALVESGIRVREFRPESESTAGSLEAIYLEASRAPSPASEAP